MTGFAYSINANWSPDTQTPFDIGQNGVRTLDALSRLGPAFANWSIVDASETYIPLDQARDQVTRLVDDNVRGDRTEPPWPGNGYCFWASRLNPPSVPFRRSLSLDVAAGARDESRLTLEAGGFMAPPDPDIITYPGFKGALVALASIWPCPWLCANAFVSDYWRVSPAPGEAPAPYSAFHMAWIAYPSAPLAAGLVAPADLVCEPGPNGGLILSAVTERLDPTNPDHLRRCKLLVEILIERIDGASGGQAQSRSSSSTWTVSYDFSIGCQAFSERWLALKPLARLEFLTLAGSRT